MILSLFSYHLKHFLLPVLIPILMALVDGGGGADTKLGRKS